MSGNQALNVNYGIGGTPALAITNHGSDWYFTVCAIMTVSSLAIMGLAMTKPRTHRLFHYMTSAITFVAAIAYFTMGSGLGQTGISVEFVRENSAEVYGAYAGSPTGTREIFYVRYIDWVITTPLLLLDLMLTAGVPVPSIAITILADEIMIITGLVGALVSSSYKWGFFTFGCVAFFFVVYQLVVVGRQHARALGSAPSSVFMRCGVLTIFLWFLYPIAWGLSEGGNVIHPDSEAIFYGILDVLAKPVFGFMLVLGHNSIDPAILGINLHDPAGENTGRLPTEKSGRKSNGFFGRKHAAGTDGPVVDNTTTAV